MEDECDIVNSDHATHKPVVLKWSEFQDDKQVKRME